MLYSEYADAVRVTARDLDAVEPGWYRPDRVDLDQLYMASLRDCLLGQVFGYYSVGLERLAAHRTDVAQEGMPCGRFVYEHAAATGGTVPVELWRREVLARRERDAGTAPRVTAAVRADWVRRLEALRDQPHVPEPGPVGLGRSAFSALVTLNDAGAPFDVVADVASCLDDREYVSQVAS